MNEFNWIHELYGPDNIWRWLKEVPSALAGHVKLVFINNDVLSVQPNGTIETRAPGTDGPFEQLEKRNQYYVSDYEHPDRNTPYVFISI